MRRQDGGGDERYVVVRPHAKGGIGQVSVALDVAVEPRGGAERAAGRARQARHDSRARFQLEAEVTARLEHPGIVPVYAIGCNERGRAVLRDAIHQGRELQGGGPAVPRGPRLAAGCVDGESWFRLQQLLRRFIDVCDTIEYAHSRGVIHRDLKPSNVVVGKYGETLVVDWGLAKFVGRDEQRNLEDEVTLRPSSHSGSTDTIAGHRRGDSRVHEPGAGGGETWATSGSPATSTAWGRPCTTC